MKISYSGFKYQHFPERPDYSECYNSCFNYSLIDEIRTKYQDIDDVKNKIYSYIQSLSFHQFDDTLRSIIISKVNFIMEEFSKTHEGYGYKIDNNGETGFSVFITRKNLFDDCEELLFFTLIYNENKIKR